MSNKPIHLSGLNGLRALAALAVVWGHTLQGVTGDWGIPAFRLPIFSGGVTLFFVLSGFLITYLLLQEKRISDTVRIKAFYMRRILRIWPIYYAYIAICAVVFMVAGISDSIYNDKLWYYLLFFANIPFISATFIPIIGHFWSIGVEEQFYLFWPWLVKYTRKYLLSTIIIVGGFWFGLKLLAWLYLGNNSWLYEFFNVTRFHCMMLGAIGAVLYERKIKWFMQGLTHWSTQTLIWGLFIFAGWWPYLLPAVIREESIAVMSLIMIVGQVHGKFIINLENRVFDFIGKISYGIYVIHPLLIYLLSFLYRQLHVHLPLVLQYILIYVSVTLLTILIAWLSYTYFEKPFLKLKDRFAVVKSRNTFQI